MSKIHLTQRERRLVHAAADALYWLSQLQDDLRGHLEGEQQAMAALTVALRPYKRAGVSFVTYPAGEPAETLPHSLKAHLYAGELGFCFGCGFVHAEDYADCVWRKVL